MYLLIDAGNTSIKLLLADATHLFPTVYTTTVLEIESSIRELQKKYTITHAIMACVRAVEDSNSIISLLKKCHIQYISWDRSQLPLAIAYDTPDTLGQDRLMAAIGANHAYPLRNILVIDSGTCIKYDFVDASNIYQGGSISLGINMRFRALKDYTSRLPLLEVDSCPTPIFTGKNTTEAIYSGVVTGVIQEIEGFIAYYTHKYSSMLVILTGGNSVFLSQHIKYTTTIVLPTIIFVGLQQILLLQLKKQNIL